MPESMTWGRTIRPHLRHFGRYFPTAGTATRSRKSRRRCISKLEIISAEDYSRMGGSGSAAARLVFQTNLVGGLQRDEINGPRLRGQAETSQRNGKVEPARAGA